MKKIAGAFLAGLLLLAAGAGTAAEYDDYSATIAMFKRSPQVQKYFDHAYGYALFPEVGKAAFILGYARGQGQVYRGDEITGFTTVNHFSLGFQGGGQVFSQILFFQDRRAYDEFTRGAFEVDARAVAVAVTAGAQAQAGTTGVSTAVSSSPSRSVQVGNHYSKGLAIFVQNKGGLMLDVSAGLQRFSYETLHNRAANEVAGRASGGVW